MSPPPGRGQLWARHLGVALRPAPPPGDGRELGEGLARALRDGVERGYEGPLPAAPAGSEWFTLRAGGDTVGLLALRRELPAPGAATFLAVAVDPSHRGHDYGTRALLAAERRLGREGIVALHARVPRTNGRGLYFILRAGYAPGPSPLDDGATWFRRFAPSPYRKDGGGRVGDGRR